MTDKERIAEFIRQSTDPYELQTVLDERFGGSIASYMDSMGLNTMEDLEDLIEEYGGESGARRLFYSSFNEEFREIEELREKERRRREAEAKQDADWEVYKHLVVPLMQRAVQYARRWPEVYSIRENESSTYIYGPGGTIRFSDHPQKVAYDSRGRPVVRGGWAKGSQLWAGDYYPPADYTLDPSSAEKVRWEDVLQWLEAIAEDEDLQERRNPPHWASKRIHTTHWGWVVDGKVYDFLTHEPEDGEDTWDHGQAAQWLMSRKPELARRTLEAVRRLPGGQSVRSLDDMHWQSSLFYGFEHAGAVRFLVQPPDLQLTTAFLNDNGFRDKIRNLAYTMRSLARHAEQWADMDFAIGGRVTTRSDGKKEIRVSKEYVLNLQSRSELIKAAEELEVIDRRSKFVTWLRSKGAI